MMDTAFIKTDIFSVFLLVLLLCCSLCRSENDSENVELFMHSVYKASVREHFPFHNKTIRQLLPVDPPVAISQDLFDHPIEYIILSGNDDGYFRMDPKTGDLYLVRQVDRERLPESIASKDRFSMIIQATMDDQSLEPYTSLARLIVDVEDVNDNIPRFEEPTEHVISIVENLPVGFNVLKLTAHDLDVGENGRFKYGLIDASGAFQIDPITGWLRVIDSTPLDRERTEQLTIRVIALEERPSLIFEENNESFALIDIHLTDVNDNSPVFQPSNLYSFSVNAAAEAGAIIGQVEAVDADTEDNALVSYAIQQPQNQEVKNASSNVDSFQTTPFSVHPQSGHIIVVDTPLTMNAYTLLIEANDQPTNSNERRTSLAIVQISVHHPVQTQFAQFINTPYEFWVNATSPVNTTVGRVKALGLDERHISYRSKPNSRKSIPIAVDLRSGFVRVTGNLTAGSTYSLNVSASDSLHEDAALSDVVVHVAKDEQTQDWDRSSTPYSIEDDFFVFKFHVTENAPPSAIGRIVYPPSGPFGKKKFEFLPLKTKGGEWPKELRLARNGTLYTRAPLDREIDSNFTLSVIVQDKGRDRDTVQLIVTVLDVNDNAPEFEHSHYIGRINKNASAGEVLRLDESTGPIQAFDLDSGPYNNAIRYSLTGQGSGFFRIDPATGEVAVVRSKSMNRDKNPVYNLTVTAKDGVWSSTAQLTIVVENANALPPEISGFLPSENVVALERAADRKDLLLEKQIVVCADGTCSAPVTVDEDDKPPKMPNGQSMATFNSFRSKILSMMDEWLDSAERSLEDSPPDEDEMLEQAFQKIMHNSSIFIQLPYNFPTNSSVGVFGATGADPIWPSTPLQRLRFSLHSNESDLFEINPFSGDLMLKSKLMPEKVYSMEVQVNDPLGLASEMTSVSVQRMAPVNHRPQFLKSLYELFLTEGAYNEVPIMTFEATDQDDGDNGILTYSLLEDKQESSSLLPPFEIDRDSGVLSVNGIVDREKVDFYRFTVHVSDSGTPPLKNQANVVVHLQDINDNAPQFEPDINKNVSYTKDNKTMFSVSIPKKSPAGTFLIQVQARDADADLKSNANVSYNLDSHQKLFHIDSRNGSIYTKVGLDRMGRARKYDVMVVASDAGTPRQSSVTIVQVTIDEEPCNSTIVQRYQSVSLEEELDGPQMLVNLTSSGVKVSLLRIEPESHAFMLDDREPILWLIRPLDREIETDYSIHLNISKSKDVGGTSRKCIASEDELLILDVRVLDINDNVPVFPFDDQVIVVASDTPVGQTITVLIATDADEGINAEIEYMLITELSSSSGAGAFTIESSTGVVSVSSDLNNLAGRILHYQVRATDREGNGLSSTLHLAIHVLDQAHQVALVFATETEDMIPMMAASGPSGNVSHVVGSLLGMEVWVKSIEPHVEGDTVDGSITDVTLYARNFSSHHLIPSEDFERVLYSRRNELEEKLHRYNLREIRSPLRKLTPATTGQFRMETLEVTLVTIGAAVLLGAIVAIICIVTSKKKIKNRRRLLPLSTPIVMPVDFGMSNMGLYGNVDSLKSESLSSGSKVDIYNDMAENSHSHYFARRHTAPSPPAPVCSNCHRRKPKQCKCCCGGKPIKPARISQSTATVGRLSRSQGELYRRSMSSPVYHVRPSGTGNKKEKQVRLKAPKRSMSDRVVRIEPPVVHHFVERHQSDGLHRNTSRRASRSPPLRVDHRHFSYHNEASDQQYPSNCSSGDTIEDSLE